MYLKKQIPIKTYKKYLNLKKMLSMRNRFYRFQQLKYNVKKRIKLLKSLLLEMKNSLIHFKFSKIIKCKKK